MNKCRIVSVRILQKWSDTELFSYDIGKTRGKVLFPGAIRLFDWQFWQLDASHTYSMSTEFSDIGLDAQDAFFFLILSQKHFSLLWNKWEGP